MYNYQKNQISNPVSEFEFGRAIEMLSIPGCPDEAINIIAERMLGSQDKRYFDETCERLRAVRDSKPKKTEVFCNFAKIGKEMRDGKYKDNVHYIYEDEVAITEPQINSRECMVAVANLLSFMSFKGDFCEYDPGHNKANSVSNTMTFRIIDKSSELLMKQEITETTPAVISNAELYLRAETNKTWTKAWIEDFLKHEDFAEKQIKTYSIKNKIFLPMAGISNATNCNGSVHLGIQVGLLFE